MLGMKYWTNPSTAANKMAPAGEGEGEGEEDCEGVRSEVERQREPYCTSYNSLQILR